MKCQVLIHWLTFSVKETDPNKVIQTYLGMDPDLFQLLALDADANVSRIDIACDDRAGYLNMDDILTKTQTNEINSRMTTRSTVISFNGQERSGVTISSFRVRILDKALEQGEPDHWGHVKLVMHSNKFINNIKQDSQLTVLFRVGITYLPGPSPDKYFRQKRA